MTTMDFVDLDKVLDEFEEEEKAALCIVPGQELKPSGYVEFLHKHQEQDWASLNSNTFAPTTGYTLERRSIREPVNISYDDPFDSFSQSKLGFIQDPPIESSQSLNGYDTISDKGGGKNQSELVTSLTPHRSLDGVKTVLKRSTSDHKGTIACQSTEVQTDALSPNSERALMSSPFPQSDILVDGPRDTVVNSELVRPTATESDTNSSPIYASVDSDRILSGFPVAHAPSTNIDSSGYTGQFSSAVSENSSTEAHQSSDIIRDNTFNVSNQPVGFQNNVEEDLDDDAVDMYLNDLDEEGLMQTSPSAEDGQRLSSSCAMMNTSHSRSLADELQEAEPHGKGTVFASPEQHTSYSSIEGEAQTSLTEINRLPVQQENLPPAYDPPQPSQDMANKQAMFNALVSGKMEIEEILDERDSQLGPSRISVGDSLLREKTEIEGILDEVAQNTNTAVPSEGKHFADAVQSEKFSPGLSGSPQCNGELSTALRFDQRKEESLSPGETSSQSSLETSGLSFGSIESGSQVMTLGIGARPKDPTMMKKNRPNSLLGLSKVNLASAVVVKELEADGQIIHSNQTAVAVPAGSSHSDASTALDGLIAQQPTLSSSLEEDGMHDPADLAHKMKRPTTLNLPSYRPDFNGAHPEDTTEQTAGPPQGDEPAQPIPPPQEEPSALASCEVSSAQAPQYLPQTIAGEPDVGGAPAQQEPESGPVPLETVAPSPEDDFQSDIGNVAPFWIPDAEAPTCMICQLKFTMWKRRHHCRACGKVLCATCCSQKAYLPYMENKEARVCVECYDHLNAATYQGGGAMAHSPNPNNPNEYCSKVPPSQQVRGAGGGAPTVMVPTGVLKTSGSQRRSGEPKQVMFSDGIRPGGDLTELDGPDQPRAQRRAAKANKRTSPQHQGPGGQRKAKEDNCLRSPSLIPESAGLPPLYIPQGETGYIETDEALNQLDYTADYKADCGICYAVNKNLSVNVKILNLDCCVNRVCWSYVTKGMGTAGQCELVVLLELLEEETSADMLIPPRDIFVHLQQVYQDAMKGHKLEAMSHAILPQQQGSGSGQFLGSREYGGFLYLPASFQCLSKLSLPQDPPYLFGLLLQRWEAPWARLFPIRLMLRLGAEYRYYPCPLVGVRERKSVFYEIGHTIINLLADFRNFQYSLSQIQGLTIHMQDKKTIISFPKNRYEQVMRVARTSNEHVMALGSSFSMEADSHLVCIQNEDGNYQTQAINIQNKPRLVTGASFVIFNGALKSSAGLSAKMSIVEDGLMIQVLPESLSALKESLKSMSDHMIQCGPTDAPEETMELRWVEDDTHFNVGVKSYIDSQSLEGVESLAVQSPQDVPGGEHGRAIRWTRVYFLRQSQSDDSSPGGNAGGLGDPRDLSRLTDEVAQACCLGLARHIDELYTEGKLRLGLRVKLTRDSLGFEVGSQGQSLNGDMMNSLDGFLIPIIHQASEEGIVMELLFHLVA